MIRHFARHRRLLDFAEAWGQNSTAKRKKVGAVIALDDRIISTGYNGTPPGADNSCEGADGLTKDNVLHAEENALIYAARKGIAVEGSDMFCSHSPCIRCARMIVAAGVKRVFWRQLSNEGAGLALLQAHGVETLERPVP